MNLSASQTIVVVFGLLSLVVLTALHTVDGNVTIPVISAVLANALGYVNGKGVAKKEGSIAVQVAHAVSHPEEVAVVVSPPKE